MLGNKDIYGYFSEFNVATLFSEWVCHPVVVLQFWNEEEPCKHACFDTCVIRNANMLSFKNISHCTCQITYGWSSTAGVSSSAMCDGEGCRDSAVVVPARNRSQETWIMNISKMRRRRSVSHHYFKNLDRPVQFGVNSESRSRPLNSSQTTHTHNFNVSPITASVTFSEK